MSVVQHQEKMLTAQLYVFERETIDLPLHLQTIISQEINDIFKHACDAASKALRALEIVEDRHAYHFKAMCPRSDSANYDLHVQSINRLLDWTLPEESNNPTLAPSSKISAEDLHFYVDQCAYDAYVEEYTCHLEFFMSTPYGNWLDAKAKLKKIIAGSDICDMAPCLWRSWLHSTFFVEMAKWESRIESLLSPSWEEIIDEVYKTILERVEPSKPLANEFYISAGFSLG